MTMTFRVAVAALLLTTALGVGCSRSGAAATTPTAAAPKAAPAVPVPGPGSPQLVDSADRVHIEYRVYGSGEPAIVLIHGWSCNSQYWRAQLDALTAHYTVVTLDLAGHGGSGRNRTDWSMRHYAEDVAAVAHQLSNRSIVLVGHSMGGPVALEAAPLIGNRVIGIIGVDTFKSVGLPPPPLSEVEKRIAPFRSDFVGAMHDLVTHELFTSSADPALVRLVADDMSHASPSVALPSLIALNQLDFANVLPQVHVPIVTINSDLGRGPDEARAHKLDPDFRVITLKGTGHFLMLEDPKRFNPVLLKQIELLTQGHGA
jgi:pimeloyl-ACP methyl ester carboxylesterase